MQKLSGHDVLHFQRPLPGNVDRVTGVYLCCLNTLRATWRLQQLRCRVGR